MEIFAQPVGQIESAGCDFFGHSPPAPPKPVHEGEWRVESDEKMKNVGGTTCGFALLIENGPLITEN